MTKDEFRQKLLNELQTLLEILMEYRPPENGAHEVAEPEKEKQEEKQRDENKEGEYDSRILDVLIETIEMSQFPLTEAQIIRAVRRKIDVPPPPQAIRELLASLVANGRVQIVEYERTGRVGRPPERRYDIRQR